MSKLNPVVLNRQEDETLEYMLDLPEDKQKYLKTVVAFANGAGGDIVFGIRDHTREIVGFTEDEQACCIWSG